MLLKEALLLRLLSLRLPLVLFLGPRVVEADDEGCAIQIPLTWRSRNQLIGAMYLGALCVGADLAAGFSAAKLLFGKHRRVRLVFGALKAEFLKRADGDVLFRSRDGRRVAEAVRRADSTGERVSLAVEVVATVPKRHGEEPVARFTLEISLKRRDGAERPG
jgi:acyl-coenzyme A thioesterase PaaI-like protein